MKSTRTTTLLFRTCRNSLASVVSLSLQLSGASEHMSTGPTTGAKMLKLPNIELLVHCAAYAQKAKDFIAVSLIAHLWFHHERDTLTAITIEVIGKSLLYKGPGSGKGLVGLD